MLEGLEVSVLKLSEVQNQSIDFRIESEYFKKEYRDLNFKLKSKKYFHLSYFLNSPIQTGHTPSMRESENYGGNIKFIKTDNLRDNYIKPDFNHYLSERGNQEIIRTFLKPKDILTTIIGATFDVIARSCIIYEEILPANINQNIALIRVNQAKINPEFLNLYLNTKFGKGYLRYLSRQTEQVNLNCREVEQLLVPVLDETFQHQISLTVIRAHEYADKSKIKYQQAEQLLLQELGISEKLWQTKALAINNKTFKDSFADSGRLDAEYYQLKYDKLEKIITRNRYKKIKEIRKYNSRGLQPIYVEDGDLDVINSKHILEKALDYNNFEKTSRDYWNTQEKARVFTGDILTYTTGANIGRTQVYQSDKKALASNHVNIIRLQEENPFYVGFVLNSVIGRLQTEKRSAGSAQAELYPKDLDEFMIPLIEELIQKQIVDMLQESFNLKTKSEHLLEIAKQAVEMAIETDEATAIEFINANT